MVVWRWVGLGLLAIVILFLPSSSANAGYAPGVKSGDWAEYDIQILGNTHLLRGPFGLGEVINTQYSKMNVVAVTQTNVTLEETIHYLNGTDYLFTTFKVNVNATEPNFLIASGLNSPDPLTPGSAYNINSTETHTVLGSERTVNYLNEYSNDSGVTVNEAWAWDRASGFLVTVILTLRQSSESETFILTISKTNLWTTPTIFGLPPTWFYGMTGVVLALGGGVAAYKVLRSRMRSPFQAECAFKLSVLA